MLSVTATQFESTGGNGSEPLTSAHVPLISAPKLPASAVAQPLAFNPHPNTSFNSFKYRCSCVCVLKMSLRTSPPRQGAGNGQSWLVHNCPRRVEWLEMSDEIQARVWQNWGARPVGATLSIAKQTILKTGLMFLGNWTILEGRTKGNGSYEYTKTTGKGLGEEDSCVKGCFIEASDLKGSGVNSQRRSVHSPALPPAYTFQILRSTKRLQRKW